MSFAFTADRKKKFKDLQRRYPDKRSLALPVLHLAQEQEGFLSSDTVEVLAGMIGIHPGELMDTMSFYTMFQTEPRGKYLLQVCQTLSCSLAGADEIVDHFGDQYNLKVGGTTEDGNYTLIKVECLGSCGTGPVIQINDDYYEKMTLSKVDRVLGKLK